MLVSQAEYARERGVSRARICQLVREGKIPHQNRRIDPTAANAALAANGVPYLHAPSPIAEPPTPSPLPSPLDSSAEGASYIQSRALRESYRARKEKIVYEQMTGKLVDIDEVVEATARAFTNVRVRMRSIPRSLAGVLAGIGNHPAEIEKALSEAIDDALNALAADVFAQPSV
jgi:hypothetical protein